MRYFAPTSYCGAARCEVVASYAAGQAGAATPTHFYIGARIHISGTDHHRMVAKISSVTGAGTPRRAPISTPPPRLFTAMGKGGLNYLDTLKPLREKLDAGP